MSVIGIIPARMGSSRFPGKPMAKILGMPMIGHVFLRSKMSHSLDELYVATPDEQIYNYINSIGGKAVITLDSHVRCTDRITEAVQKIEISNQVQYDVIVNIQGDEPMVHPKMIDDAIKEILDNGPAETVNLMAPLATIKEHEDINEVKVVVDKNNNALYFSREPIPSRKMGSLNVPMFKQVCIIAFKRDFLFMFSRLEPTPLEIAESVDMMRAIEHGYKVKMLETSFKTYSVDTSDDLSHVEKLLTNDDLLNSYIGIN
ncbi:MAG TPA: 3-deoxy-manno-octulosonate cytidylyltransferase [Desulfotomaculum sp.]|nr:MAG: 3-deoxy-D-manno-octulosonate cytidylyltransferase [Desulfotomaculum sp. 46_296]HAG10149.1 3-deoxy-manno-octulosonate cytidylyltransferase [Desulfotomaculum sp.]HBY03660.1 3-deoxy-manno-octulosonate cytidylyltransferase [Desulfotomaculum sp.]